MSCLSRMKVGSLAGCILLGTALLLPLCSSKCTSSISEDEEGKMKIAAWQHDLKTLRSKTAAHSSGVIMPVSLRGVNEGSYEILENGAGKFRVHIEGCPTASANIESVSIDDVELGLISMGVGEDGYKVYCPGAPKFGNIVLRVRRPNCDINLMEDWWMDATQRENETKAIAISSYRFEGPTQVEVRRWDMQVVPLKYDPGDTITPRAELPTETVTCEIKSLALSSSSTRDGSQKPGSVLTKAFVDIASPEQKSSEPAVWESISGGSVHLREEEEEACVEVAEEYTAADGTTATQKVNKLGTKPVRSLSMTELSLAGPVTDGREDMCTWLTAAISQDESASVDATAEIAELQAALKELKKRRRVLHEARRKRDVRMQRVADGDEVSFLEAVVTRYSFPSFSRSGTADLTEQIAVRPNRIEFKA